VDKCAVLPRTQVIGGVLPGSSLETSSPTFDIHPLSPDCAQARRSSAHAIHRFAHKDASNSLAGQRRLPGGGCCVAGWVWTGFPPARVVLTGRAGGGVGTPARVRRRRRVPPASRGARTAAAGLALDLPAAYEGSALLANTLRDPNVLFPARRKVACEAAGAPATPWCTTPRHRARRQPGSLG